VDTDQIIPKQFLKRIERTGYGQFLFYNWRFHKDGKTNADFELNAPRFRNATILIAGSNFGCGSSREHAPWALLDYGFRAILAPSFSDIFYNNCLQNGMLPIRLSEMVIKALMERTWNEEGYQLTIDLESQTIRDEKGLEVGFEIDPFRKKCLLNGLDDIGLTLQHEEKIRVYESSHAKP
jgi:3-isopropylmalate/(R)-2-methylmalate dehydratase small subunit